MLCLCLRYLVKSNSNFIVSVFVSPCSLRPILHRSILHLHLLLHSLNSTTLFTFTNPSSMASISHAITTATNPHLNLYHLTQTRSSTLRLSHSNSRRILNNTRVFAEHTNSTSTSAIDFNDPDWKIKFQQDFESRFRLPHITDIFPDSPPIPSTFCLKMRTPIGKDIPGHYSLDEEWHGYINNNDRVLLKVRCKIPQYCDDNGAYVVVTDYGEGDRTDFILSPRAFSKLGRNALTSQKLKKYGVLDVEYKRVPCTFKGNNIVYQINENTINPGYFAINILYVGGTYDVTAVQIWKKEQHIWEAMRRSYGAVFDFANPPEGEIRLKFQVSSKVGSNWVVSQFTIPAGWKAGATYSTKIHPY